MSSDAIDRSGPADEDDRHAALALMLHGPRDHGHVSMADKATATYLNDHLAAASFAVDLVVRLREWAAGTEYDDVLLELAGEFEADRGTLVAVMARLGVAVSPAKQATSWIGRRLSRAKLSGFGPADAPTALLEALETLASGVDGKGLPMAHIARRLRP